MEKLTSRYINRLRRDLLTWHIDIDRKMPWKDTQDPYKIWLSEVILQQTRVAQGLPYYLAFIKEFPRVELLAEAEEDKVLKLWQGLGYYSRARNLHLTAQIIVDKYDGVFPTDYKDVLSLKGIGPYTATAIVSFAYGQRYAVVDGNVKRVLSRVLGIVEPIDVGSVSRMIDQSAQELIDIDDPASYNQAIMDLGATVCMPKSPLCDECPFSTYCIARKEGLISLIPIKKNKVKKRRIAMHFLVVTDGRQLWMVKRDAKGIWKGLYQPLLVELDEKKLLDDTDLKAYIRSLDKTIKFLKIERSDVYEHILTHRNIDAYFYKVNVLELRNLEGVKKYSLEEFKTLPLPKLIENYMMDEGFIKI